MTVLRSDDDNASGFLLDRGVRHAVFLERFKSGEARKILGFLDEHLYPDLLALLTARLDRIQTRGFDRGPHTTARLKQLTAAIDRLIGHRYEDVRKTLNGVLFDFARMESDFQRQLIRVASPIQFELVAPSSATLRSIVTARPFQGRLLRQWWRETEDSTRRLVRSAINIGIAEGEGTHTIVRRVRAIVPTTRRGAESVVRTAVNHVSSHARERTWEENSDLVKGVRYTATLDGRTTLICASLDGQVFPVGKGPRPPQHRSCRSTTTPVLKSWKEMGISLPDAPPGTRASLNGQVPESLTYGDWLRRQPTSLQNDVLGRTRGRLFREGRLPIDKFTDRAGNTLTLEQLRSRESDVFDLVGV